MRTPATPRLTRQHFALYRGWLEGAALEGLHAAYGETDTDIRLTRRMIATMRDTLAVVARRARDIEAAHLLRLRPGSLHDKLAPAEMHGRDDPPSLEDYRAQVDPDGFYGEAELLDLYQADFPPQASPSIDRKIARNARLRQRQAAALARMEQALAEDPAPEHPVDGWFEPSVAARLCAAGVPTLADLLALIDRRRQRWYTAVPRLGPKGAARIVDWLDLHAAPLRHEFSPLALHPRRSLTADHPALTRPTVVADIAPIEAFAVPVELDGSTGSNRAPVPAGTAAAGQEFRSDIEAIRAWIRVRGVNSEHTVRAYRREAERLLLWAVVARGKAFSSLNAGDADAYLNGFLADPQPAARWVGRAKAERFDPAWRPFTGPLPVSSRETARKILSALCAWLVKVRYLLANPFDALPRLQVARPEVDTHGRTLTHAQWRYVLQTVSHLNPTHAQQRDAFALLFAYATGLRRAELATATLGALDRKGLDGTLDDAWTLKVRGKGGKPRVVPMPGRLMEALRALLRLTPGGPLTLDSSPRDMPLLVSTTTGRAMTADGIGLMYKRIFAQAAARLETRYPGAAADLQRASTHWLRHTHANHALDAGSDLRDVKDQLGHASLGTTTLYTKGDAARRYESVERFFDAALDASATGLTP
ncbi:tyrosine-type recombinase/integrase [Paraburkholderia sp. Ac-20340]|uniref:site-specific integrase n=1 Tax=Paraburkholderia sp. Ac-20340 TaxID=2703888 RepID=UPI00197F1D02|nr:site-specific integrase [Paraburkholderia sp. Ac-20340]MBN3856751.1 tyrosine-type recombinase/integrase [Paraburkholderia sp. Ac-20340]